MNLEEVEKLPDRMPTETLALIFQNVLNEFALENIDNYLYGT